MNTNQSLYYYNSNTLFKKSHSHTILLLRLPIYVLVIYLLLHPLHWPNMYTNLTVEKLKKKWPGKIPIFAWSIRLKSHNKSEIQLSTLKMVENLDMVCLLIFIFEQCEIVIFEVHNNPFWFLNPPFYQKSAQQTLSSKPQKTLFEFQQFSM